jgi:hypothetical protein
MSRLRAFTSSLQPPTPDSSDDQAAKAQGTSTSASGAPPDQQPAYAPPQPEPFHQDPFVGPGKAVDPKDKIVQTPDLPLDPDALRKKLTDPLGTSTPSQDSSEPSFGGPPLGSSPPGPDYTWTQFCKVGRRSKIPGGLYPFRQSPIHPPQGIMNRPVVIPR